ncbi:uncharacterized protein [Littorina saxatilis]|uniref:uncharacterized protein n=1 Tax=Littorina saxatilis TaxID=31220 RepID=UPI0038B5D22B
MSHLRKYLVGLTALLVVNTLAMARQHYSTSRPIQQNMPHGCSHIYDCPDYLSAAYWSTYQNRCCLVKNGSKYHCQQNFVEAHGGHTDIQVVCVYPKTCAAGYYAYLKTWIEDGITYGVVSVYRAITTATSLIRSRALCSGGRIAPTSGRRAYGNTDSFWSRKGTQHTTTSADAGGRVAMGQIRPKTNAEV